ncbi:MAG TPA: hypothetical protein VIY73_09980 [Polyangiaceae bacterium]
MTLGGGGNVWGVAVDATQVFWGIQEGGQTMRASLTGAGTESVGMNGGWTVAVDDTEVYSVDPSGTVLACPKSGCTGAPRTVASGTGSMGIAVDDTNVYWAGNGVYAAPKAGGSTTTLTEAGDPYEVAVDDSYVYWTDNGGPVMRVAKGGGTPQKIADTTPQNSFGPMGIAVDCANAYFLTSDGKVWQVPKDGSAPPVVLASDGGNEPWGIAVDGANVYYAANGPSGGGVESVPIGGGCVTVLASGVGYVAGVAVDAKNVTFASGSSVLSVPK